MAQWYESLIVLYLFEIFCECQGILLTILGRRGEQGVLQTIKFNSVATGEDRMSKSEVDIVHEIVGVWALPPLLFRIFRKIRFLIAYSI